ncbi:MAG: prolyl oligopeptidase family serine peptidase [Erythrobacter sp.]|nr:prolyl oligopeptidase family serine peptidase [Erythrobacter sp.]
MKRLMAALAAVLAGSVPLLPVHAQSERLEQAVSSDEAPALIPTENFAGRSAFRDFEMSPDGKQLAIERSIDGTPEILVLDAAKGEVVRQLVFQKDQRIDWIHWAGNTKILLSISMAGSFYGFPVRVNRLYVRDLVNGQLFPLEVDDRVLWGGDLVHMAEDGSHALISVQSSFRSTPSVYRYQLVPDGEVERIVKPKTGVWNWYADDDGVVRLGMGWKRKRLRVYYRPDAASKFDLVGKLKADDDRSRYWSVVRIVGGSDRGYVLEEGENGRTGVRLFDYSTGQAVETFYENEDWDVEELWLKRDGTPLAALYTDDREQIVWFDDAVEKRHAQLKKALKTEEIRIVTRSRDDERMLIWAGSEADPGALYIYTPAEKNLSVLANYRPELDHRLLVKPKPVRYTARDGLEIPAYLTMPRGRPDKNLPFIILPHGGPYGVRDKLEYNDEVQVLANRGYAVLQPNFRGSGGYGDTFYEAGNGEIGRKMQDDLDDAMDWAVAEGIADPDRVCVVGGSYGGYAALWAVLRNPDRYRCAASWAGVTDLDAILKYDRKFLSRKASKRWRAQIEGEDEEFELDTVSPVTFAPNLTRPVLLAHGTSDRTVPFSQYKKFEKASRTAAVKPTTLVIENEGHGFSKTENERKWYDALTAFLLEHNPPDAVEKVTVSAEAVPSGAEDPATESAAADPVASP